MAAPDREVFVLVGDGSYLMMAQEIVTSIQEGVRLTILILDNHGLCQHRRALAVGRLCRLRHGRIAIANEGTGQLDGELLPVDFAANAASLGAHAIRAGTSGGRRATRSRRARRRTARPPS